MPDKAKAGILAVLAIAAVLSLARGLSAYFSGGSLSAGQTAAVAAHAGAKNSGAVPNAAAVERKPVRSPYGDFKRNPFVSMAGLAVPLVLDGVAWDAEDPRAVVNGEIVAVGDRVAGWVVERIGKSTVALTSGGRNVELTLEE